MVYTYSVPDNESASYWLQCIPHILESDCPSDVVLLKSTTMKTYILISGVIVCNFNRWITSEIFSKLHHQAHYIFPPLHRIICPWFDYRTYTRGAQIQTQFGLYHLLSTSFFAWTTLYLEQLSHCITIEAFLAVCFVGE